MSIFTHPGETHPGEVAQPKISVREAGGDNEVPRDKLGRPRIWVPEKNGLRSFTRVTTFIDVIEDKKNLQAWGERMVLLGVASDLKILNGISEMDPQSKAGKDALNRKAQVAKNAAGADDKSAKGTHLHALSELVDADEDLPHDTSFADVLDMKAYRDATTGFAIEHVERLVVNDELMCAGTPDRVSRWSGDRGPLITPTGEEIGPDELLITDLKTGTVEYGGLKMAMQLGIYARSQFYNHETYERESMGNVNQKWGVIMNVPAGSGECTLYWADLELGWAAVQVAKSVREMRSKQRHALKRFDIAA